MHFRRICFAFLFVLIPDLLFLISLINLHLFNKMLYRMHLDPVSITRDDVLSTLYCRGTYGECIWHIVATLSFLKTGKNG